jgi:hypothetical protein
VWLTVAESYFTEGRFDLADAAYSYVVSASHDIDALTKAYARYKRGWCALESGSAPDALEQMAAARASLLGEQEVAAIRLRKRIDQDAATIASCESGR